jgi:hypothetical protein
VVLGVVVGTVGVGSGSVGRGKGITGRDGVVDGVGVRLAVLDGIAGIEVSWRDGFMFTNTSHTISPTTTATEKPATAHSQGRGPRGGSGGGSTGVVAPVCGYVWVQYCGSDSVGDAGAPMGVGE